MQYDTTIIYVTTASQNQCMFYLYADSKRQVLLFFLKDSKLTFLILNSNLFHSRGGGGGAA